MRKNKSWLFKNIIILTSSFIVLIILITMGIVYYWSFYHFSNIFEDRIIDEYTIEDNEELGVKNEWILGVTTDSIDVLEAIHGKKVANNIVDNAMSQKEITKLYKEKVGNKHLIYMIDLDTENGEFIYKYSVIKDIYAEVFPQIAFSFLIFAILLFFISYMYTKFLSNQLYTNIDKLVIYTEEFSKDISTNPINLDTGDKRLQELGHAFNEMNKSLNEKEDLQQSTLEYISHEMKTPIMIIESYANSAKDGIFPKDDLDSSLDTIINQADRMKNKVNTLMTVARVNSSPIKDNDYKNLNVLTSINNMLTDLMRLLKDKTLKLYIDEDIYLYGDIDKIQILLENLIENQIKYSDSFMSIRGFINENKTNLLFYNDGAMIDDDIKDEIFKSFIKGPNGINGLGLSICNTIANQHKGELSLISTKRGTLFKLEFPIEIDPKSN